MRQWLLIGFIALTGLQGQRVWLVPAQVVSVREPVADEYPHACKAVVATLSNSFCVLEQPLDIVQKLENSK